MMSVDVNTVDVVKSADVNTVDVEKSTNVNLNGMSSINVLKSTINLDLDQT